MSDELYKTLAHELWTMKAVHNNGLSVDLRQEFMSKAEEKFGSDGQHAATLLLQIENNNGQIVMNRTTNFNYGQNNSFAGPTIAESNIQHSFNVAGEVGDDDLKRLLSELIEQFRAHQSDIKDVDLASQRLKTFVEQCTDKVPDAEFIKTTGDLFLKCLAVGSATYIVAEGVIGKVVALLG